MFVRRGSSLSTGFRVTNGVRQGSVLSPLLFNVYINDLSIQLSQTGIGGSIDGKFVNHMIYADDLCVISLSSSGLQSLLNICTDYCQLHDLTFIAKKSVCMFFRSSVNKQCGLAETFISGTMCAFANEVKYLGVIINSSLKTTIDVKRQTRNFYSRANLLIRNFRHCTDNVKCYLFQSYCTSMYCCQLWFNSTKGSIKKLRTSYNSALRRFLVISKPYSASQMLVVFLEEYYRLMSCYVNVYIGLSRELITVQIQLCMPAYHHLFSYTLPFVNGGAHYCMCNGIVLTY